MSQHDLAHREIRFEEVSFADLGSWQQDRHLEAFQAFHASCTRLIAISGDGGDKLGRQTSPSLLGIATKALAGVNDIVTDEQARQFFEDHFFPHRVVQDLEPGLLTGYYEPELRASRTKSAENSVPLLRRPPHLVNLVSEADRGRFGDRFSHALQTSDGTVECPTRKEIEFGALKAQGLEFAWLSCPVDAFFLHVEGSGVLHYDDGTFERVTYDGKNGHPYTSVGKHLIETGVFQKEKLTFQTLKDWLQADLDRARDVLWQNKSYIFFRPLTRDESDAAIGVMQIPLVPLRSLAVDTAYHEIGTPIFVCAPTLEHAETGESGFFKLMIAHDVGSAIRGPERGDIFFGSGSDAGEKAGQTVHAGLFYVLKPKQCIAEA